MSGCGTAALEGRIEWVGSSGALVPRGRVLFELSPENRELRTDL